MGFVDVWEESASWVYILITVMKPSMKKFEKCVPLAVSFFSYNYQYEYG